VYKRQAQSWALDLDRKRAKVAYINFPTEPILNIDDRNYSVQVDASMMPYETDQIIDQYVNISGLTQVNEIGYVHIDFNFSPLMILDTLINTDKRETKNKDGQIKVTYSYTPVLKYSVSANVQVMYPDGRKQQYNYGSRNERYTGNTTSSKFSARNYFDNNTYQLKTELYNKFVRKTADRINKKLNTLHGYEPVYTDTSFLILDSKKYPEYEDYKKVEQDLKSIFSTMTPYDDVAALKPALTPIIDFLDKSPERYPKKKRAHRKLRYASYYNIAQIYYYLDEFDKAKTYYQKVIDNDYREGNSKRMMEQIKKDEALLQLNQVSSRHLDIQSSLAQQNLVYLDAEITDPQGALLEGKIEFYDDVQDPIPVLQTMQQFNFKYLNDNDEIAEKTVEIGTIDSITVAGKTLQKIQYFANSNNNQKAIITGKLEQGEPVIVMAEKLYGSDKVALFGFANELILQKASEQRGTSTSSTAFSFAFKKKLGAYFSDCASMQDSIKSGKYKNEENGLIQAVQDYTACR